MTKEQEEAIDRCNELIKSEHANWIGISNQNAIETVLNMLKEKDKEIESLEKTLDKRFIYVTGARTVCGRLMQLDKESIIQDDLKRRNELNQCIKVKEKYKELYYRILSKLVKVDRENIKKDRQIDLMAEYINKIDVSEEICEEKTMCDENCKDCTKQYFKSKAEKE